jgi:hypothetical protein
MGERKRVSERVEGREKRYRKEKVKGKGRDVKGWRERERKGRGE